MRSLCSLPLFTMVRLGSCPHAVQTVHALLDLLEEIRRSEDAYPTR